MTSIKELSWLVDEATYRTDDSLSYSTIAKFHREGFKSLPSLFNNESTSSMIFGSVVDTLITEPERFPELFEVCGLSNLSDNLDSIVRTLAELYPNATSLLQVPDYVISQVCADNGYYANDKFKSYRVKLVRDNCSEWFSFLTTTKTKTVITQELYSTALNCVRELKNNKYTKHYFFENAEDNTNEIFYQLKFKGEYNGINLRCMIDILIVDHKNKLIIPVDLKTSSKPEYEFPSSYFKWCYFMQSNLYTYLLENTIKKDDFYKDYTIANYLFIVINKETLAPMVWKDPSSKCVNQEAYTFINTGDYKLKHWKDVAEELHHYLTNKVSNRYPIWVDNTNNIFDHVTG